MTSTTNPIQRLRDASLHGYEAYAQWLGETDKVKSNERLWALKTAMQELLDAWEGVEKAAQEKKS